MPANVITIYVPTLICFSCDNHTKEVPLCIIFFGHVLVSERQKTFIHVDGFCSSVFISDVHIMSSLIIFTNLDQEFKKCGLPVHLMQPSH